MKEVEYYMKNFKLKKEEIKQLTELKGGCIASDRITVDGLKVGYMYRETPTNETDSGWRFFSGDETDEYTNDPDNFNVFELNTICNYDESIIPYLNSEIGTSFEKENNVFRKITD